MTTPATSVVLERAASSEQEQLVEVLQSITRSFKAWIGAEVRRAGLSGPKFWALHQIVLDGPVNVSHLAESCSVTPAHISAVVEELCRDGLVERTRSETDRRVVHLVATPGGRAIHRSVWFRVSEGVTERLARLGPREIASATRALSLLARAAATGAPRGEGPA